MKSYNQRIGIMHYRLIVFVFLFCFFSTGQVFAAAPVVNNITVTDVTPGGFSVLWNSDQAAFSFIRVYNDANGNSEAGGKISISANPLKKDSSFIRSASEQAGIMQVRVNGLTPSTSYYFQTLTLSAATGEMTLWPETTPLSEVTTMAQVDRSMEENSSDVLFSNDLVLFVMPNQDGSDMEAGTIVAVEVPGCAYPVSGVAGDSIDSPFVIIDATNFYDNVNFRSLVLQGEEQITVTRFYGMHGFDTVTGHLMPSSGYARLRPSYSLVEVIRVMRVLSGHQDEWLDLEYDMDGDGRIGTPDALYFFMKTGEVL